MTDCPIVLSKKHCDMLQNLLDGKSFPKTLKHLIFSATHDIDSIERLSVYFKHGFVHENRAWLGIKDVPNYKERFGELTFGKRFHVSLNDTEWEELKAWEIAFGSPLSHAACLLAIDAIESKEGVYIG